MMSLLRAALVGMALVACGSVPGGEIEAPPAAPSEPAPFEVIPADLDVVVRIDLERIREALPPEVSELVQQVASDGDRSSMATNVVVRGLSMAERAYVGFRPGGAPELTDNVLVLTGQFANVSTAELHEAFQPPLDLGGGWWRYTARAIPRRSAPARLYTRLDRLWVVASEAEVDAVERVIERGVRDGSLEPTERGIASIAARLPRIADSVRLTSPKAAQFLARGKTLHAHADLTSSGLTFDAEMSFFQQEDAESAAAALRLLLLALSQQPHQEWLARVRVESVLETTKLRAEVPPEILSRWSGPFTTHPEASVP